METKEYRYVDKSKWPNPGEWDREPDKIQWQDEVTGLPCLIVRGPSGALCGYVGVSEGHKFYAIDYSECAEKCDKEDCWEHSPRSAIEVHGGLTFSKFCREDAKETGICHIPGPGEPDKVWWFGFDCAHCGDLCPAHSLTAYSDWSEWYKGIDYVKGEVAKLARQLAAR